MLFPVIENDCGIIVALRDFRQKPRRAQEEKRRGPLKKPGNREDIMIVEDESILAENLKQIVEGHGYKVIAVVLSGEEAIEQ